MDTLYEQLSTLPTLATGQAADLKHETDDRRFWLARTGPNDGEPYAHTVHVEAPNVGDGVWRNVATLDADVARPISIDSDPTGPHCPQCDSGDLTLVTLVEDLRRIGWDPDYPSVLWIGQRELSDDGPERVSCDECGAETDVALIGEFEREYA